MPHKIVNYWILTIVISFGLFMFDFASAGEILNIMTLIKKQVPDIPDFGSGGGSTFPIPDKYSGEYIEKTTALDIHAYCQTQNGCPVQSWERNYTSQQTWYWSNGEIRTSTGKCLDVEANCQTQNGCPVQIWDCNGTKQQVWIKDGKKIRSGAGRCLVVMTDCKYAEDCANKLNGIRVGVYDCDNFRVKRQGWEFVK